MKVNPISTRAVTFAFASCAAIATAWILLQMADLNLTSKVTQTRKSKRQTEEVSPAMSNLNAGNQFTSPPDEIFQIKANVEERKSELEASQRKSKKLNDLLYVSQAKLKKQEETLNQMRETLKSRELELEASLTKNKKLNDLLYKSRETLKQEQFKLGQLQKEIAQLQDQNELLSISLKILLLLVLTRVRATQSKLGSW